ncbi:AAA family ATPase, partial [Bacillus subtilis]
PWGVRKLGDPYGFLLGELIANDRPVFMNPERPAKELQRANTILICGDPGSGKTTTGKHIAHNLIEWDATGYIEDPKGDYDLFAEHPTVKLKSRVISFAPRNSTADFDRVNFNIFRLAKEKTNRNNAASTILDLLLNAKSNEYRSFVIDEAMYKVFDGDKWDMTEYTLRMEEIKNSHADEGYRTQAGYCIGHLKRLRENGIASLLF